MPPRVRHLFKNDSQIFWHDCNPKRRSKGAAYQTELGSSPTRRRRALFLRGHELPYCSTLQLNDLEQSPPPEPNTCTLPLESVYIVGSCGPPRTQISVSEAPNLNIRYRNPYYCHVSRAFDRVPFMHRRFIISFLLTHSPSLLSIFAGHPEPR